MAPSASISTPQALVPRDFDEIVTRQSSDEVAFINRLSEDEAQTLKKGPSLDRSAVVAQETARARGARAQKENLASSDPAEVSKAPERARITYVDM
jgi:hypothetical protein